MKKFFTFLFEALAVFGFLTGIYYLYKKYVLKETENDEELDDDFDDFDFDDEDFTETVSEAREYVTLNSSEGKTTVNAETASDDAFDEISD